MSESISLNLMLTFTHFLRILIALLLPLLYVDNY